MFTICFVFIYVIIDSWQMYRVCDKRPLYFYFFFQFIFSIFYSRFIVICLTSTCVCMQNRQDILLQQPRTWSVPKHSVGVTAVLSFRGILVRRLGIILIDFILCRFLTIRPVFVYSQSMPEMMGELFQPHEMPEPPKQGFFIGLFGGGSRSIDREELCKYTCLPSNSSQATAVYRLIIENNLVAVGT